MNCPRCDGLLVNEYFLDHLEGLKPDLRRSRCLNCGAIHDDVIRMHQRILPRPKQVRHPRRWPVVRFQKPEHLSCSS